MKSYLAVKSLSETRIGELEGQLAGLRKEKKTLESQAAAGQDDKDHLKVLGQRIKGKDKAILKLAQENAKLKRQIKTWKENTWHAAR